MNAGNHIKDLRIFKNREIRDIVIVDNAIYSFSHQLFNGIPIISWFDNRQDEELKNLKYYLKLLAHSDDIREVNRLTFRLDNFCEGYVEQFSKN